MNANLESLLTPDAFTTALQVVVDAFRTRSDVRVYAVPNVLLWADETVLVAERTGKDYRAVVIPLLQEAAVAVQRKQNKRARVMLNRAKYILTQYQHRGTNRRPGRGQPEVA